MTKSEFLEVVTQRAGLGRGDTERAVEAALDTIQEALSRGGEVSLTGFGRFHVAQRGERRGVNPSTGQEMQIPMVRVPRFTAGSRLKRAVRGS